MNITSTRHKTTDIKLQPYDCKRQILNRNNSTNIPCFQNQADINSTIKSPPSSIKIFAKKLNKNIDPLIINSPPFLSNNLLSTRNPTAYTILKKHQYKFSFPNITTPNELHKTEASIFDYISSSPLNIINDKRLGQCQSSIFQNQLTTIPSKDKNSHDNLLISTRFDLNMKERKRKALLIKELKDQRLIEAIKGFGFARNSLDYSSGGQRTNFQSVMSSFSHNSHSNNHHDKKDHGIILSQEDIHKIKQVSVPHHHKNKEHINTGNSPILAALSKKKTINLSNSILCIKNQDMPIRDKKTSSPNKKQYNTFRIDLKQTQMTHNKKTFGKGTLISNKKIMGINQLNTLSDYHTSESDFTDDYSDKEKQILDKYKDIYARQQNKRRVLSETDNGDTSNNHRIKTKRNKTIQELVYEETNDTNRITKPGEHFFGDYAPDIKQLSKLFYSACNTKKVTQKQKIIDNRLSMRKDALLLKVQQKIQAKTKVKSITISNKKKKTLNKTETLSKYTSMHPIEQEYRIALKSLLLHTPVINPAIWCKHILNHYLEFGHEEAKGFIYDNDNPILVSRRNAITNIFRLKFKNKKLTEKEFVMENLCYEALHKNHNIILMQKYFNIDYNPKHDLYQNESKEMYDRPESPCIKKSIKKQKSISKKRKCNLNLLNNPEVFFKPEPQRIEIIETKEEGNADFFLRIKKSGTNVSFAHLTTELNMLKRMEGDLKKSMDTIDCLFKFFHGCIIERKDDLFRKTYKHYSFLFDLNAQNDKGDSLLIICAKENMVKIAQYLLEQGIDVNIQNNNDCTALHYAISNKHFDLVNLLIKFNANEDIKNSNGKKAWECTVELCDNILAFEGE